MVSLRISGLGHEFDGREVFAGIDVEFEGTCLAVFGPNGSGKSTLLRILAGLLTPISGEAGVWVDGQRTGREGLRRAIGLASPDVQLYADLTPRENLDFLASARGLAGGCKLASEALEAVGLQDRADDAVAALSSGLRRRACLAAAIVHEPRLLLLDEPTSNLDEDGARVVRSLIDRQRERGMVVLATSDLAETGIAEARLDLGAAA